MYEKQVDEILYTRAKILISFYYENDKEKKEHTNDEKSYGLWYFKSNAIEEILMRI